MELVEFNHADGREKLTATWRLLAEQMIDLGYHRQDIFDTMTAVGLSFGVEDGSRTSPEPSEVAELRLPRATWEFHLLRH